MNFSFNYYHNLDDVELYLCNPDGKELYSLNASERKFVLRFNDLSSLSFKVPSKITLSDGTSTTPDYYDFVQTKRLINVPTVGWFQITSAVENSDGKEKYKSVEAESYQTIFKNKGLVSEERVYKFYNPQDPTDANYDYASDESIPSVVGQMYRQLGIEQDLAQGLSEPSSAYSSWTITYVTPTLMYVPGTSEICRTFKDETTYGYDWMVKDVEDAFKVIFIFDFKYKTIQVLLASEITDKANVLFSFNNFMKNIEITEKSDDIVTVLSCSGNNIDITSVNPTGTNYIVDFSYYMDKVNYRWMSAALIAKLEQWEAAVESQKSIYENIVLQLRTAYQSKTELETELASLSIALKDLKNARDQYIVANSSGTELSGIVTAENVKAGERSCDIQSGFYLSNFISTSIVSCHSSPPVYVEGVWSFPDSGTSASANTNCINDKLYFFDGDQDTYCKLNIGIDSTGNEFCSGFVRYAPLSKVSKWVSTKEALVDDKNTSITLYNNSIGNLSVQLSSISSSLNILNYFSSTPALLKELNCYWVEGDYTNENIAVLEDTTQAEAIDLANELLESGQIELNKLCRPRFSFSIGASDALRRYEFRHQMNSIELGKIITIEKDDGVWYYPALLQMEFNLDDNEDFSLLFANALRLDDWGYTYADLISDSAKTSRQVGANWQNLMDYSKNKSEITSLIKNPLDATLRAGFANAVSQEFIVDNSGVLGRKRRSNGEDFEDEQIRIINNVILFTDDGWETAKSALGKIYYTDSHGNNISAYGLIAETIIGSLIMSEKTKIINATNTISLDNEGIIIKKIDGDNVTETFKATPSGDLTLRGAIAGGTININDNFVVDSSGNVVLNGNITWGVGTSPTQVLYSSTQVSKPTDGTTWASVQSSGSGWHKTFASSDIYGTYTYDGGNHWTEPLRIVGQNGTNGDSQYIEFLYYRNTSSTAPATPSYSGELLPSGWSLTPYNATSSYPYIFVSQGSKTNGNYNNDWSTPKVWAKYGFNGADGEDGSDASVTDINVFNALTNNASQQGIFNCFTSTGNKLYINASYIKAGQIDANLVLAGQVTAQNIIATGGTIGGWNLQSTYFGSSQLEGSFYITSIDDPSLYWIRAHDSAGGGGNRTFSISKTGELYASSAQLTGSLTTFKSTKQNSGNTYNTIGEFNSGSLILTGYTGSYYGAQYSNGCRSCLEADSLTFYQNPTGTTTSRTQLEIYNYNISGSSSIGRNGYYSEENGHGTPVHIEFYNGLGTGAPNARGYLEGHWSSMEAIDSSSDNRLKHDIDSLSDNYSAFFDGLIPRKFKYNFGTSNRYHTGFIAQEVESAIAAANLTANDLALFVRSERVDNETGATTETLCLRYEEFIALNTMEIQKLKARVEQLELAITNITNGGQGVNGTN